MGLLGWATGSRLLLAAAYVGFFLNLFNLLPVVPLDGGRAMAAVHPAFWIAGLAALAGLFFLRPNPILIILRSAAWRPGTLAQPQERGHQVVLRGHPWPAPPHRRHLHRAGRRPRRGHAGHPRLGGQCAGTPEVAGVCVCGVVTVPEFVPLEVVVGVVVVDDGGFDGLVFFFGAGGGGAP